MDNEFPKEYIMLHKGKTSDLGISILVVYTILFVYIIINSVYNKKFGFSIINKNRSFYLSDTIYNSEKLGGTFIILLFTGLTIWLLIKQHFHKYATGIVAIISLLISNLLFISLFKFKNNTLVVSMMFVCSMVFVYLTLISYLNKYGASDLNELSVLTYTLTVLTGFTFFFLGLDWYVSKKSRAYVHDLLGITNLMYVVFYSILIYYISLHPTLDDTPIP